MFGFYRISTLVGYLMKNPLLLWTPTHGRAKTGRPARTYIQQLREDTGCCPEDLPRAMKDREKWRERVRDIRATSTTRWWWWYKWTVPFQTIQFSVCTVSMSKTVLFQTIQFSISTQFNCQNHFYFNLFSLVKQFHF